MCIGELDGRDNPGLPAYYPDLGPHWPHQPAPTSRVYGWPGGSNTLYGLVFPLDDWS